MKKVFVLLALLALSCARPTEAAQATLSTTAQALLITDEYTAEWYTRQAKEALLKAETRDEYDEMMSDENSVEQSLRIARASLFVMQEALDAWRNGNEKKWMPALKCGVLSLTSLYETMREVGLQPSEKITESIEKGLALIKGELTCR